MNSMLTAMRSGISAVGRRMGVNIPQTLRKLLEGTTACLAALTGAAQPQCSQPWSQCSRPTWCDVSVQGVSAVLEMKWLDMGSKGAHLSKQKVQQYSAVKVVQLEQGGAVHTCRSRR